jgi:hypothetical protein
MDPAVAGDRVGRPRLRGAVERVGGSGPVEAASPDRGPWGGATGSEHAQQTRTTAESDLEATLNLRDKQRVTDAARTHEQTDSAPRRVCSHAFSHARMAREALRDPLRRLPFRVGYGDRATRLTAAEDCRAARVLGHDKHRAEGCGRTLLVARARARAAPPSGPRGADCAGRRTVVCGDRARHPCPLSLKCDAGAIGLSPRRRRLRRGPVSEALDGLPGGAFA